MSDIGSVISTAIKNLANKAGNQEDGNEAMKLSQAALNLANAKKLLLG